MDNLAVQGNDALVARVRQLAARRALSHAIILSGPGDLSGAARYLAAAMECQEEQPPCLRCNSCRKVFAGIHPDVIQVEDTEHKNLSIDVLRALRADAYILPNEGLRKVYIFPDCSLLDPKGQNVLLKVVEEGPAHAAFLFCAENSAVLLPTIRSRCVEWNLGGESDLPAAPDSRSARLWQLLQSRDALGLTVFFTGVETDKVKREELLGLLEEVHSLAGQALLSAYGCRPESFRVSLEPGVLNQVVRVLERYIRQLRYNLGVGHVAGALAIELSRSVRQ